MYESSTTSGPSLLSSSQPLAVAPETIKPKPRTLRSTTREAYIADGQLFLRMGGTIPCDAVAILRYIDLLRTKTSAATVYRRVHSIRWLHLDGGHPTPTEDPAVKVAVRWLQSGRFPPKSGAKSKKADEAEPVPPKRAAKSAKPLTRPLLLRVLDALGRDSLDRRDRALLLLAFFCGLKRAVLVSINVDNIRYSNDALLVTIRGSTDPDHPTADRVLAVPNTGGELDVALAVRQYVEHLALEPGTPLFRSFNRASEPTEHRLAAAFVSELVKRRVKDVGLDPTDFSGESMRRGRALEISKGLL